MASVPSYENQLLSRLSKADLNLLRPHLESVPLPLLQYLEHPNTRIHSVYFVEAGMASVVAADGGKDNIEVGVIGPEGMTGATILLGDQRSLNATYVQAAGRALRMDVAALRKAISASPSLRQLLLKYVQTFMAQTSHTAVANGRAGIEERLARWLLMVHDRLGQNRLPMTHKFLAVMLGVRRAGVTEAVTTLEQEGLITATRGQVTVRNRKGLERRARNFYGTPEAEYRRLIGERQRPAARTAR